MTAQITISEGNKDIVEFMCIPKCQRCAEECGRYQMGVGLFYLPEEMKYHSSWDWLMNVIDKIEKLGYKVYIDVDCIIDNHGKPPIVVDGEKLEKINTVWLAVVQFIEWYNQQKAIK